MTFEFFIIICVLIIGFVIGIIVIQRTIQKASVRPQDAVMTEWLRSMQRSIEQTNRFVSESIHSQSSDVTRTLQMNTRHVSDRLDTTAKLMADLQRSVGEMAELGKGIAALQEFLQSPKLRGNLGERVLSEMITQAFPKHAFHLQHQFASGVKVDAAITTDAGILCIDSKFPMEQFVQMRKATTVPLQEKAKKEFLSDVKGHMTSISSKYILPEEGTLDFALMYIPSESVYYEVVNSEEVMEVARQHRIYPVSPTTLYAHLQVLLLSFQGKEVEKQSREVLRLMRAIQKDYDKAGSELGTLTRHIQNAYTSATSFGDSYKRLGEKLSKTTHLEIADNTAKKLL